MSSDRQCNDQMKTDKKTNKGLLNNIKQYGAEWSHWNGANSGASGG
jgi:hypothetical protein